MPDVVAAQTAALHHWQRVNTALYWHIVPAVDITGPQYLEDLAHIDSFVSGQQADARGLLVWLFRFVDLSGIDAQLALSNALVTVKLGDGATLAQLASHVHKLQQVWLLTASATASYTSCDYAPLVQLYEYLLASMPTTYTAPGGMHMVSVRTWLVGKCADLAAGGGHQCSHPTRRALKRCCSMRRLWACRKARHCTTINYMQSSPSRTASNGKWTGPTAAPRLALSYSYQALDSQPPTQPWGGGAALRQQRKQLLVLPVQCLSQSRLRVACLRAQEVHQRVELNIRPEQAVAWQARCRHHAPCLQQ